MFRRSSMRFAGFLYLTLTVHANSRFTAPTNEMELMERLEELQKEYKPYLRSLPETMNVRRKTPLNGRWKFTFEVKDPPRNTIVPPPAPGWHGESFDDSKWQDTTVPEWRYRTRDYDNAYDLDTIDSWMGYTGDRATSQICWYRCTFKAKPPKDGHRTWLCFDGVDWEAEVYLNGKLVGRHRVYYEKFRFDVTGFLKEDNTLAVRVIDGLEYGEPMTYWATFPDIRAEKQRYTPNQAESIIGNRPIGYHCGTGFGIHRDVYLEETGPVAVRAIFVRNDLTDGLGWIRLELDSTGIKHITVVTKLIPENFEGVTYSSETGRTLIKGLNQHVLKIAMTDAKVWSPRTPYLYRCRVTVKGGSTVIDSQDALFGCRNFAVVNGSKHPKSDVHADRYNLGPAEADIQPDPERVSDDKLPDGMLMLNDRPIYLRGTNVQGLNVYAYWGQADRLINAILMLKAANFNAIRSCQHVQLPEVREMLDRLGIMSEQDQGGGYQKKPPSDGLLREQHINCGRVLARVTYNNPGIVLLCFANEHQFDPTPVIRAALAEDPRRVVIPISGRFSHSKQPLILPSDLWDNVIDDGHPYAGWYKHRRPPTWIHTERMKSRRMVTLGEYGAEAMDSYETMKTYPDLWKPPAKDEDTLWASAQINKHDAAMVYGLTRRPTSLGEYIEASQKYQESLMADKTIGFRLSARSVSGYFHFHFIDVIPVFWPKSIVSHDHRPKMAYYQMAQINQPIVALPQFAGKNPDIMGLWVCNDLPETYDHCTVDYSLDWGGENLLKGTDTIDLPAIAAVKGKRIDISAITAEVPEFDLTLVLKDSSGYVISTYRRNMHCLPKE